MKKRLLTLTLALLLALCLALPASATTFLTVATGGTSGTYFPLGGDLATLFAKNIPDLDVTAQATGASAENIRLISQGEAELAIVQVDVASYAYTGTEAFENEQITNFAVIGNLYPEVVQLVFSDAAGINSLADLKGKRVSIGAAGSGVYQNAVHFLEAAGLTLEDIEGQYLSFAESAEAIKNRQIDAAFITAGIPNSAVQDVASTHDIELINLSDEELTKLTEAHPFYVPYTVPAGTYQSQTADETTVSMNSILIVSADMDEQLAYDITKTLFECTDQLSHAKKAEILLELSLIHI